MVCVCVCVCVCVLPLLAAAAAGQFLVSGFRSLHILDVYQELGREWDRSILIILGNLYSCRESSYKIVGFEVFPLMSRSEV